MSTLPIQHYEKYGEPEIPIFGFCLPTLLGRVISDFPKLPPKRITVWIRNQPMLATVTVTDDEAVINLHAVLNHDQTPEQVIGFILRHELLHVIFPAREVDGRETHHPPEFRHAEQKFADRVPAWNWLWVTFSSYLTSDKKREGIFVNRKWKNHMNAKRLSIDEIMAILSPADVLRNLEDKSLF